MRRSARSHVQCAVCGRQIPARNAVPLHAVLFPLLQAIQRESARELPPDGFICREDLNRHRAVYINEVLRKEIGELGGLEREVFESLHRHELVSPDAFRELKAGTFGERLADRLASFGGSWTFILFFMAILVVWIAANSLQLLWKPFDPFPFILLNLVLSCLAAFQAPVIMMSQNRQEARDRQRAINDYKVNLKAELEIRHLHEKLDHMMIHQWQRLVEIQQIQIELLEEMAEQGKASSLRSRKP